MTPRRRIKIKLKARTITDNPELLSTIADQLPSHDLTFDVQDTEYEDIQPDVSLENSITEKVKAKLDEADDDVPVDAPVINEVSGAEHAPPKSGWISKVKNLWAVASKEGFKVMVTTTVKNTVNKVDMGDVAKNVKDTLTDLSSDLTDIIS